MEMMLHATSADELAKGFRNHTLCLPFKTLQLSGPNSSFEIRGVLTQEGENLLLQYMPISSKEDDFPQAPVKPLTCEEDFWQATGTTWDGAPITMKGLLPPWDNTEITNDWGKRYQFSARVQKLMIHREDHCTDAILERLHGEEKASIIIERRKSHPSVHAAARIANVKLKFLNESTTIEKKNIYFKHSASSSKLDSLIGKLDCGVKFCFRQDDDDVVVYMDSLDDCTIADVKETRERLFGLITAFSFMHGCHALPWRVVMNFNDYYEPDVLSPQFQKLEGDIRTCKGPYELGYKGLALHMMECAANYFGKVNTTSSQVKKFLWQMNTGNEARIVNLHECLLLCSILEGVNDYLLRSRLGWTDSIFKTKTAMDCFQALTAHYKIHWLGQFEKVFSSWKQPRNCLAHGDLFSKVLDDADTLFRIKPMIGGGIYALLLADMGWQESIDFNELAKHHALYYS